MKILLTNTVVLNGGEAATVASIVQLLRRTFGQDTAIVVYDQKAEVAGKYYDELTFRQLLYNHVSHAPRIPVLGALIGAINRRRFSLAAVLWGAGCRRLARALVTRREAQDLREYGSADVIVSSGGTYLVENYDLRPRIFDYEISLSMGKPLVFFTQSLGPFRQERNRRAVRRILSRARLVLLRDEASLEHVRELGVESRAIYVCADAAFALGERDILSRWTKREPRKGPLRAAISVRHWPYFRSVPTRIGMERYMRAVAAGVTHLVRKHRAQVSFVSTCQGIPEYWFDDSTVALEIARLLDGSVSEHVKVDRAFRRPMQLIDHLESFDLVVATRFHMAVLSLLAGTPALAISYEFKTEELYKRLGIVSWLQGIEQVSEASLCEQVDRCVAARSEVAAALGRALEEERAKALEAAERLAVAMAEVAPRERNGA